MAFLSHLKICQRNESFKDVNTQKLDRADEITVRVKKLKVKADVLHGNPSQNYHGVPPKYGAQNFTCSPT